MNYKISICFTFIAFFIFIAVSCEYNEILPEQPPVEEVSFQDDVIPIFNEGCNTSGCHGGPNDTPPDLSPANAYNALNDGNYIDILSPEDSELYKWMIGNGDLNMPPNEEPNSFYNATILKWIQEGAQNN